MSTQNASSVKPKRDVQRDYWFECVQIASEECGAQLTEEQIDHIAGSVESGHENYGMAFYSPSAGEYLRSENERLKRELRTERDKVPCPECKGSGNIVTPGPYHYGVSQCARCRGEGKCAP